MVNCFKIVTYAVIVVYFVHQQESMLVLLRRPCFLEDSLEGELLLILYNNVLIRMSSPGLQSMYIVNMVETMNSRPWLSPSFSFT